MSLIFEVHTKRKEKRYYFILKSPRNILYKASMHIYMILGNIISFNKLIIDYTSKVPTRAYYLHDFARSPFLLIQYILPNVILLTFYAFFTCKNSIPMYVGSNLPIIWQYRCVIKIHVVVFSSFQGCVHILCNIGILFYH